METMFAIMLSVAFANMAVLPPAMLMIMLYQWYDVGKDTESFNI